LSPDAADLMTRRVTSVPDNANNARPVRRPYDSPLRRQQAARTRERIIDAGSDLVHGLSSWDWRDLTVRAAAERAGVSERTVYRHFSSERELQDAVMRRLHSEAGVTLEGLGLDQLGDVATRVLTYLSSFAIAPRSPKNPTFVTADQHRREAMLAAVELSTRDWAEAERNIVAAILDVFWTVPFHERLVNVWHLDADQAGRAITWALRVLVDAIKNDHRPDSRGEDGKRLKTAHRRS
jgi:AcrR family transcriptional regulator